MDGVPADVYIDLKSDEPFVEPAHVEAVLQAMRAEPTHCWHPMPPGEC